jgi:GMP synthase (glutamine-hydrolysing)
MELPGARQRRDHFAARAVHDVVERAWLREFLDGWLARMPLVTASEIAVREAAE